MAGYRRVQRKVPKVTPMMKAGCFLLGFLLNVLGILLAFYFNRSSLPAMRKAAVKYAAFGFIALIIFDVLLTRFMLPALYLFYS